jgi:Tol biopolymer transport system component
MSTAARRTRAVGPSPGASSVLLGARLGRRQLLKSSLMVGAGLWLAERPIAAAADPPTGLIALPRGREIGLVRPDGTEFRTVVNLAPGEFIADVALSPDGSQIAFGLFTARTGEGPGGSDIVIARVDNDAERTVVVPRDRPGMLLAAPQWSPDGQALIFEAVGLTATGQAGVSAEWVAADGSGRRAIAQSARYPSFAPDGKTIVYTRVLPTGDALWEHPVDGGEGREIIPDSQFLVVVYPRYRPDGKLIAFGGVGEALPGAPGLPGLPLPTISPTASKLLPGGSATEPGHPRTVAAHGFPAEPYVVSPSGGDPRRLAELPIDDAAVAWSPDGAWVAVSGASGLFLVGLADGEVRRVTENGSFGAIDWR